MTRFPIRSVSFRVAQAKSETFAVNGPGSRVVVVFIQNRNVVGRLPSRDRPVESCSVCCRPIPLNHDIRPEGLRSNPSNHARCGLFRRCWIP